MFLHSQEAVLSRLTRPAFHSPSRTAVLGVLLRNPEWDREMVQKGNQVTLLELSWGPPGLQVGDGLGSVYEWKSRTWFMCQGLSLCVYLSHSISPIQKKGLKWLRWREPETQRANSPRGAVGQARDTGPCRQDPKFGGPRCHLLTGETSSVMDRLLVCL